jgi:hypothetical protein
MRTIEDANVIEPKEASSEQVVTLEIFAVHPPSEVEQQFLKDAFEKSSVSLATGTGHFVHPPGGPGMHRRIHITEASVSSNSGACRPRRRFSSINRQ